MEAKIAKSLLWVDTKEYLPQNGQVVLCAYNVEEKEDNRISFGVNIATYKDGIFYSANTNTPDYWMEIPPIAVAYTDVPEQIKKGICTSNCSLREQDKCPYAKNAKQCPNFHIYGFE